jgi:hypothetical protein
MAGATGVTFDVADPSWRFWLSGHRRRVHFVLASILIIASGLGLFIEGLRSLWGGPSSAARDLYLALVYGGSYTIGAGVAILTLLGLAERIIDRVTLSADELSVYVRNPRTQFVFPEPIRRRWARLRQPIRMEDYTQSPNQRLAGIPIVIRLGNWNRGQLGGLDRAAFDALIRQAKAVGLEIRTEASDGLVRTTILPPGSHFR